ncbi:unnamed protein product [Rotaria socialis]|uniref:Uridine diphosphate glucose pyrophosphatase NUDT14 n=1 Tax=Rotaria socialis TaxID=392032 RepID=A0A818CE27_9BILA|nr:unnamed protein product [Rotaria socialis]CAF3359340.1 unnamed protein product [Rotaria socialis]CAF3427679.1 unnamed protein product [Rotaria socialis]CAF3438612.1 unnamed protein product [Rotaria socialis]CAF3487178.1 unnamed protein product [Rotaria socialis]
MSASQKQDQESIKNASQDNVLTDEDLCRIKDFQIGELPKDSTYIRPFRAIFIDERNNNPVKRMWDAIDAHNSVVIIVYNRSTDSLVFVRQFRPAVYVMMSKEAQNASFIADIDFTKQNPKSAITYEFCAGIIDKKHLSNKEHAHVELLEECGYSVDINSIESVAKYRSGIGIAGAFQELFYVEVTNEMKTNAGGGNLSEFEFIAIHEVHVDELYQFLFDETKAKEASLMFGVMWFLHKKGRLP